MSKKYLASFILLVVACALLFQNCGEGFRTYVNDNGVVGSNSSSSFGTVSVQLQSPNPFPPMHNPFEFRLMDTSSQAPVLDRHLAIMSEKKLHVIAVDSSLNDFTHFHPVEGNGVWRNPIDFKYKNQYFLFIQGRLTNSSGSFLVRSTFNTGDYPQPPNPPASQVVSWEDEEVSASVEAAPIYVGQPAQLVVSIWRGSQALPQMSPYLGEVVHATSISHANKTFQHLHPEGSQTNGARVEVSLHATFTEAGYHGLWVEFIEAGKYRRARFFIRVNPRVGPPPTASPTPTPTMANPPPTTSTVSFRQQILPILNAKCLSCHGTDVYTVAANTGCRGWISFVDQPLGSKHPVSRANTGCNDQTLYQRLIGAPWQCTASDRHVVPGNPTASYLYRKITGVNLCDKLPGQVSAIMPPPLSPQLTGAEKELFRRWIVEGAPNN